MQPPEMHQSEIHIASALDATHTGTVSQPVESARVA